MASVQPATESVRWWQPRLPQTFDTTLFTLSSVTVITVFVAWVVVTATGFANELFLPGPVAVYNSFIKVATKGYQGTDLLGHVWASLYRILVGFGLAIVVGIPLGIVMGVSKKAAAVFNPLIEFYRPLPPLGLYTLLVMWLGIGEASKFALLFLAGLPGIILATIQGVSTVDPNHLRVARSLGASRAQILRHVYLPASWPIIHTGLRISLGFIYTVLVAAEIVAATAGIGWMIWDAAKFLLSDVVIMGLIVLGLTGVLLDLVMRLIGKLLMPWAKEEPT